MSYAKFRVKEISATKLPRWKQYALLVVGKTDLASILKYELITSCVGNIPGALGLYLRSKLYPFLLGAAGSNVVFGKGITLRHPHKIFIGRDVVIDDNCVLDAKGDSNHGITIGERAFLGRNSMLYCKNGDIEIHSKVVISFNCEVFSSYRAVLEQGVMIGAYSYILSGGTYDLNSTVDFCEQDGLVRGATCVGANCLLGAKVTVLDGVQIGKGCAVGAGTVVRENLPENVVVTPHQKLVILPRNPERIVEPERQSKVGA